MSDEHFPVKPTTTYPADVGKAMQLLSQKKIVDAEAVVEVFSQVREEAARQELKRVLEWLKKQPCPTPATWPKIIQALESGDLRTE